MPIQLILDREFLNWLSKNRLTLILEEQKLKYSYLSTRIKVKININQWELKVKSDNLLKARENVCDQAGISFSFQIWFPLSKLNWKLL